MDSPRIYAKYEKYKPVYRLHTVHPPHLPLVDRDEAPSEEVRGSVRGGGAAPGSDIERLAAVRAGGPPVVLGEGKSERREEGGGGGGNWHLNDSHTGFMARLAFRVRT